MVTRTNDNKLTDGYKDKW